ncbi:MAG: hypothetical protein HY842_01030 [Bacteroidetes bacterium]|nr:hypothetical protein [Bacteroidota bacterium]
MQENTAMKYFTFSLLALFLTPFVLKSQTLGDAVRYSFLEVGGTARTVGIGGGIGAIGADFSVLSTNPAGLATFRRSELTFTPAFVSITDEAQLEGTGNETFSQTRSNFNFNNIGLVFPARPMNPDWTNTAFGIGLNRLAGFYQNINYDGTSAGSITDRWLDQAQGLAPNELDGFEAGLAFDAEAIYQPDPDNDPTNYLSDFDLGESVYKSQSIRRKGAYNEIVFSYAGNYREKLMIGATLGVPIISFEETKIYQESDEGGTNLVFNELTFTEKTRTSGAGINLKFGLIYRLNQTVRLGASVHTPTGIGFDDSFSTTLDYSYTLSGATYANNKVSPDGTFEYRLRTPWRLIGSAGFIFGKSGFLAAEVEYLDYTKAKYNFNNTDNSGDLEYQAELNQQIVNELTSALNIRLGGEYAYDIFRFRGGYSIMQAPYKEGFDPVGTLSVGAGIRWEDVFLDLAFKRQLSTSEYVPYITSSGNLQTVSLDDARTHFLLTMGFKF